MGLEYYLCNHKDATLFELGKGSWLDIFDGAHVFDAPEAIESVLKERWSNPEMASYCLAMAQALVNFTKGVPAQNLELINDAGEDHVMAIHLRYKCVGSRYELEDPEKNKEYIDDENKRLTNESWLFSDLSLEEVGGLKKRGWNFKNVKPKLRSRFELLKQG